MNVTLITIRAVGVNLANRIIIPVSLISAGISIVLIGGVLALARLSQWWLLLLIPIITLMSIAFGVLFVIKLTMNSIKPPQTVTQSTAVASYVDTLQRVSDLTQTPRIVLLFRVVRDAAAPTKNGFIGTIAHDTLALQKDFTALQKLFSPLP